jgi:hypothetical protein
VLGCAKGPISEEIARLAMALANQPNQRCLDVSLPTRLRTFFNAAGNVPHMPGRIDDSRHSITPELIGKWSQNSRSRGKGALDDGVDIFEIKVDHDR